MRMAAERSLMSYPKYWAASEGAAPFLPMSRQEMQKLGWDSCDIILVVGDAYVDHPSFGMAVVGRMLESQGYRVGIIAQPDWQSKDDFMRLGKPNLFYGVSAGNMDSMINRYTADKKLRHDDAYTPGNEGGKRPDRAVIVYSQRCKEAYSDVPVVIGGIEASLRRIAHYDYWQEKVRRSILFDAKADILIYGNAERPLVEVAHRIAQGEPLSAIQDVRGTAVLRKEPLPGWRGSDSTAIDKVGKIDPIPNPYGADDVGCSKSEFVQQEVPLGFAAPAAEAMPIQVQNTWQRKQKPWEKTYVKLPAFEQVSVNKPLYAHASRILHQETNPGCARALFQRHGDRHVWVNPPAFPLETEEMDFVFGLPYQRVPHPSYGKAKIPAYDMIKTSVNIMRGCFGGCSFCSITEHEGRIIQSRSQQSIIREINEIRDKVLGFTGVISDLGGPTANMYKLRCKSEKAEQTCRRLSCVFPSICEHMDTDQSPTVELYRAARKVDGVKKVLVASGVRYDLAVEDPNYVRELVQHHVGGYLKIAPEHTENGPLSKMMKPGMGAYDKFKALFDKFSKEAGKEQYLIPYFISAHPGTSDMDMVNLALWLKQRNFKLDQVQNFYPSPLANATTMYHTEMNSLKNIKGNDEKVVVPKGERQRRLHKALLRYHDPAGWKQIREALRAMKLEHLIGKGPECLVPAETREELRGLPAKGQWRSGNGKAGGDKAQPALTRHTGLDPAAKADGRKQREHSNGSRRGEDQPGQAPNARGSRVGANSARNSGNANSSRNGGNNAPRPSGNASKPSSGKPASSKPASGKPAAGANSGNANAAKPRAGTPRASTPRAGTPRASTPRPASPRRGER